MPKYIITATNTETASLPETADRLSSPELH
jgi:hypothetical protein